MSKFSGKFDAFDDIAGSGGWFDKDGKPTSILESKGVLYSDEYRDFVAFKKQTNGTLYQHHKIKVSEINQNFVKEHCNGFEIIEHHHKIQDKRVKEGYREEVTYTYTYWGKEYTLKELNKKGVYITTEIHFDTLLDLIPYYPYIVTAESYDRNKDERVVYISNESYVEAAYKRTLNAGYESNMYKYYKKALQEHYVDVVKNYYLYNPENKTRTVIVEIKKENLIDIDENNYGLKVDKPIDDFHKIEYWSRWKCDVYKGPIYDSPKVYDEHTILLSKQDVDSPLTQSQLDYPFEVRYTEKCDFPLNLG